MKSCYKYLVGLALVAASFVLVDGAGELRAFGDDASSVTLAAHSTALCKLGVPISSLDLGVITSNGAHFVTFKLLCSGPFSFRMSSRNGGLRHKTAEAAEGFDNFLVYDVSLSVPIQGGASLDSCTSQQISGSGFACPFNSAGGSAASNSLAQIVLRMRGDGLSLIAGEYEDEITLTVEART